MVSNAPSVKLSVHTYHLISTTSFQTGGIFGPAPRRNKYISVPGDSAAQRWHFSAINEPHLTF